MRLSSRYRAPAQAGQVMPGVAVIATSTWAAINARKKLNIEWDESEAAKESTSQAAVQAKKLAAGPLPSPYANIGDVDSLSPRRPRQSKLITNMQSSRTRIWSR